MEKAYVPTNVKRFFTVISVVAALNPLVAQENRTIDGTGNNLSHPDWGAVNADQLRLAPSVFADGVGEPTGQDRPNPRMISNEIFDQPELLPERMGLSDFAWAFGQFIDHDITLDHLNRSERIDISVPLGDPVFDPLGTGFISMRMSRSMHNPSTGKTSRDPREYQNQITAFIDGSSVYGSDEYRAAWLRTFNEGKLRVSTGNLLPYNTISGEEGSLRDLLSPHMDNENPLINKWFVAGDPRANENPVLIALHTLFVREHNRVCDEILREQPELTDEEVYQKARKIVGGIMQAITYEEWLPSLGLKFPTYTGYKPDVNPGIFNEFSVAAFRFGHTVLNGNILRMDNDGSTMPEGNLLLRHAFFNPTVVKQMGDIYSFLIGMSVQTAQSFDSKVIDDVRNFLFGPPGQGGLDLAALNINRGRDRGLPDYNTIREFVGLPRHRDFSSICTDAQLTARLEAIYDDVDNIDPWVGMLCEDRMGPNALFGPTIMFILEEQFINLRDGDRFYYENDPGLTAEEKEAIKNTRLSDVIMRNVDLDYMQENVFFAEERTTTSVFDNRLPELGFDVLPNPVESRYYLSLRIDDPGMATIRVTNLMGQILEEKQVDTYRGVNVVPMAVPPAVTPGIYQVIVTQDGRHGAQKMVVAGS